MKIWNIVFKNVEGLTKVGFVVYEIHSEVPKLAFLPHCAPPPPPPWTIILQAYSLDHKT
jgi:hypothetical protein